MTTRSTTQLLPDRPPKPGELVQVRSRKWLVEEVVEPETPGQSRRARNANGHLANPLPFEPTYWTTLYIDHLSYAVSDVKKTAGFYAALLGWNDTDMADNATQVSPTFGDVGLVGGAIIRSGANLINHISFGMKDWNTEVMRYEFIKRGLRPSNDFTGNLQSYHVRDAMGWDLQIGNKIGPSTWGH